MVGVPMRSWWYQERASLIPLVLRWPQLLPVMTVVGSWALSRKVRDHVRTGRIESDDIQHPPIIWICDTEAVRDHPHND